jgi:phosphohistidine phosphatase
VAKTLWLLRHGEAVPHGSKPDDERELTPKGEHQARTAGRALARLNVEFDACYASPKVRALDTGRLACEELGVECLEAPSVGSGFDRAAADDLLMGLEGGGCLLVVGHNPDFAQVVHDYTGARVAFHKGGVASIRIDGSRAELVALLRPAELETMAG